MAEMEMEMEVKVQEEEEESPVSRKELVEKLKHIFLENKKSLASEIASTLMQHDVEEPPVFRKEWVEQLIEVVDHKKSPANSDSLPRVARPLLNVNPDAYIPQFLSLGPYHHWKLQKNMNSSAGGSYQHRELKLSTGAEGYKVKSAAKISASFHSIVETIQGMRSDIEKFYEWEINTEGDYSKNFARMMVVDSFFLLCFLFSLFSNELSDPTSDIDFSTLQMCIRCDIIKLENQIPLSVLEQVFEEVKSLINESHRDFNQLLKKTCTELSPFDLDYIENYSDKREPHLLGFMHALVSPFLQMQDAHGTGNGRKLSLCEKMKHFGGEIVRVVCSAFLAHPSKKGRHDFLNAYNAGQLAAAGIKFKSFSRPPYMIRFDKYSYTLYLPRITVSHVHTEVFLRNMLALEFNDAARHNFVTRYVGLMHCIIHTPDDVRLLRDSYIIRRQSLMLSDQYIVNMWNGMCRPFYTGHMEPPEELKLAVEEAIIRNYYKTKVKSMFREFYSEHAPRLIGVCVLGMTAIQAFCSLTKWQMLITSPRNGRAMLTTS